MSKGVESFPSRLLAAGAIIVAAGSSRRMGGVDKVFASIAGKPLLAHVLEVFQLCDCVRVVVLVLNETNLEQGRKLVTELGYSKVKGICVGGKRRQDSVAEGLKKLGDCPWAVIHDGARPCLSIDLIEQGLKEAQETGAAIAAVPARDTVKRIGHDRVVQETLERDSLWLVQTPQVFRRDVITEAYCQATGAVTDDASFVESLGYKVKVYMGSHKNIKVTTPEDLTVAQVILGSRDEGRYRL